MLLQRMLHMEFSIKEGSYKLADIFDVVGGSSKIVDCTETLFLMFSNLNGCRYSRICRYSIYFIFSVLCKWPAFYL